MLLKLRILYGLLILIFFLLASGCAAPAQRTVPVEALDLSAPVPQGYVLHQLRPDLGLVLPQLSDPWIVTTEPTEEMLEHQAEHEEENALIAGRLISRAEALERAEQHFAASDDLYFLNTESEAHLLFSFAALGERQPEPAAVHVAQSASIAAAGVTAEGWTKHSEEQRAIEVRGARHAEYFEIDYTKGGERGFFTGVVGYAQPYWFWFYAYDHRHDPRDRDLIATILQTFEIRTTH